VDGGHSVGRRQCRVQRRSPRFRQPVPLLSPPGSAIQPAGPPRPPLVDGPPFGRGEASRGGAVQAPPPSPRRRRPDRRRGILEGRRSHAHACRGQPGATPSAQPLRPLRKGPPGSAVAAGNTSPGSARGLLCRFTIGRHWHSEIQDSDGP
jgi:hypothetical protein